MQDLLHDAFTSRALKRKGAIAVKCGQSALTYEDLEARSNQLAARLRTLGVGPEIPVALYLDRSLETVVAILGVLKAGGCYVPIDLAYPRERVEFMLQDTAAKLVLTQDALAARLPGHSASVLSIDSGWPEIAREPVNSQPSGNDRNSAAYIIYTSGSTGKPKGVVVTHHNVMRLLGQTEKWYKFNEDDIWPLFHSYAFDVSVWELWGSLLYGGRLVIVPHLVSRSPSDFYQLLAQEKVTVLNQTPSAFRQLVWADTRAENPLPLNLRYVICAGEALELQSLKPWFDRHGDTSPQVVNMYGITETTVHSTYRPITKRDLTSGVGSVIGVPIPDLRIYLVDEKLQQVPQGEIGEICVGGDGVARGYLNRGDLTARRFIPDPFAKDPGARIYRSGDLARVSAEGEMEYLGRMDHQVKIRGFRVELGEIESGLNCHPRVRESVVVAHDGEDGVKRLTAYVVAKSGAPTVTELRDHLRNLIPDYMIPAVFMFLPSLPLNTNGKVDRRALPVPGGERPELAESFVAPRTNVEEKLAGIWREVLQVEKVGVFDNFFELGGDSIRSIAILARAQEVHLNLSLQQMFENPTVAGMAACATAESSRNERPTSRPFELISNEDRDRLPEDVEDAYPMARLQLGMFFHNELNPLSAIYHDVFSYHIQSAFNEDHLYDAVSQLIQRHPILRTSFHLAGFSEALQLVHSQARFRLTVDDLRNAGAENARRALTEWIEREKRIPFDRTVAPLSRFHVQHTGENDFYFIVSFHHSCLDGWSLAAIMAEVMRDYEALQHGKERVIPPPHVTYRDFVALERSVMADEETRGFWAKELAGASLQAMPSWPKSLCAGGHEQVRGPETRVDATVLKGLKEMARRTNVPLKTVLLAAHQKVMSLIFGQNDITSGLLCNGRPEVLDGEKVIGLFLNTVPLRMQLPGGSWIDLVRHCFGAERRIAPHRRFPLAEIQKLNGGRPVFEAAFDFVQFHVYKDLPGGILLQEGSYFEANDLPAFTSFILDSTGEQLEFHIDYDPNRLCGRQIEEMSVYYAKTLRAMAAEPEACYENFSPMPAEERERMLVEWNRTEEDYPPLCIQELFEKRAAEQPEKIALVWHNEEWTYRKLNRCANEAALKLMELGARAGTRVGICLERTPAMIVGLLGILKTGAAYVPLDPAFPRDRLGFMLRDALISLLLTEKAALHVLPDTEAHVVCMDTLAHVGADENPPPQATPDALAYVIYTSGSTGEPKGVQVTHGAVVNLLTSAGKTIGFETSDRLLSVTTLSFDIAALELFLPLIAGGQLVLADHQTAIDGVKLAGLMASSGATVMQATPTTWRFLIESGWTGQKELRVLCGGEAMTPALAEALLTRVANGWNFYGPTETTIWSTAWKVTPSEPISIGRPLANTQLYVLDSRLQPVPVGVTGELYIAGDGLARGYLGRDELTRQKFVPDPFCTHGEKRMYKTGDCARYLPDGNVECLGRVDRQVKVRGFRIELEEIEGVLGQHEAVAHAVALVRQDADGWKRLVAYVTARNGSVLTGELRDFIRARLPGYMAPAHFVVLKEFPLTPNGKIDTRRLPAPEEFGTGSSRAYVPPRDDQERALAEIWQEVLALRQIGIDDDFFELGADSLSSTRAFARINRKFGISLPLRAVFENPTVSTLAAAMRCSKPENARRPSMTRRSSRVVKLVP